MTLNYNRNANLINGMPNMSTTLTGWEIPLELEIIKQAINDGDAVKSVQKVSNFNNKINV